MRKLKICRHKHWAVKGSGGNKIIIRDESVHKDRSWIKQSSSKLVISMYDIILLMPRSLCLDPILFTDKWKIPKNILMSTGFRQTFCNSMESFLKALNGFQIPLALATYPRKSTSHSLSDLCKSLKSPYKALYMAILTTLAQASRFDN